jgi:hypothetical protein
MMQTVLSTIDLLGSAIMTRKNQQSVSTEDFRWGTQRQPHRKKITNAVDIASLNVFIDYASLIRVAAPKHHFPDINSAKCRLKKSHAFKDCSVIAILCEDLPNGQTNHGNVVQLSSDVYLTMKTTRGRETWAPWLRVFQVRSVLHKLRTLWSVHFSVSLRAH